jgi:glycosyltransferase involved in cell wall biosynthesis
MISIIIPTFNREKQLNRTLRSLVQVNSQANDFEILVIDNGSTDGTKEIVHDFIYENSKHNIVYIYDPIPGLMTGRHRGAIEAKGEILTFIDDDVQVSPNWLNGIIETMDARKDVDLLTGPNLPLYESYPPYWLNYFWGKVYDGKQCGWLSLLDLGNKSIEIHPNYVWGLNFTIRKNVFFELKGTHPDSIPKEYQIYQGNGETGLTMKAFINNKKALYLPKALVYHEVPESRMTLDYFEKRAYFQGVCNSFTQLRLSNQQNDVKLIAKVKPRNGLFELKKLIKKEVKNLIFPKKQNNQNVEPTEILEFRKLLENKLQEGFDFHQNAYKKDAVVRDWVHREDFLDYTLPIQK